MLPGGALKTNERKRKLTAYVRPTMKDARNSPEGGGVWGRAGGFGQGVGEGTACTLRGRRCSSNRTGTSPGTAECVLQ